MAKYEAFPLMQVGNKSKFNICKFLVGILIAIPLCLEVGFLSFLALWMGIMSLPLGIVFLLLGGLGCLFVYSLIASLWLDRRDHWIVFGLLEGMFFLGIGAYTIFVDAIGRSSPGDTWTTKNYFETFVLGSLAVAGIPLSLYLLYKRIPPNRANRQIGESILFRHVSVSEPSNQSATEQPMRSPRFPCRRPLRPSEPPPQV